MCVCVCVHIYIHMNIYIPSTCCTLSNVMMPLPSLSSLLNSEANSRIFE